MKEKSRAAVGRRLRGRCRSSSPWKEKTIDWLSMTTMGRLNPGILWCCSASSSSLAISAWLTSTEGVRPVIEQIATSVTHISGRPISPAGGAARRWVINVSLLDATVAAFYGTGSERAVADQILRQLQNNPDTWLQSLNTKFFALQLEQQTTEQANRRIIEHLIIPQVYAGVLTRHTM